MNIRSASGWPTPKTTWVRSRAQAAPSAPGRLGRDLGERPRHRAPPLRSGTSVDGGVADARRRTTRHGEAADLPIELDRAARASRMCPAPSTSTNRPSGRAAAASSTPLEGGVTRSCSPTTTSAGIRTRGSTCRRSISRSSASPSVHTSDEARSARCTTCSTTWRGASGPNCVSRTTAPRRSVGLASTARRSRSTRSRGRPERPEARPHQLGDRSHRARARAPRRTRPRTRAPDDRRREEVGSHLGHRDRSRSPPCCGRRSRPADPAPRRRARPRCLAPSNGSTGRRPPDDGSRHALGDPSGRTGDRRTDRPTAPARSSCRG